MKMCKKLLSICLALVMLCSLFTIAVSVPTASAALAGAKKGGDGKIFAWGCDMSKWNVGGDSGKYEMVDFKKMKADGCDFVILRIGDEKAVYDGVRKADTAFVTLYKMAREAGMHIGAYYYTYRTTKAGVLDDVKFCLDILNSNDMYFEYPIYFDIEADVHQKLSTSKQVELCNAWCDAMVEAGYFPGVYSNRNVAMDNIQGASGFQYDTWVPRVKIETSGTQFDPNTENKSYRTTYGMWQYAWGSNSWSEPEYEGANWYDSEYGWRLDLNVAFRDYPTIMQTYGYNNVVKKHTISFETNGGSAVEAVKVKDGEKLTAPANPTKYGFSFGGWYCNPELTDPYDFNTAVPYDFTLYAKWDEAHWGAQTNLMPNSTQLQLENFNDQGAIWPYWNNDDYGSVTMYNGVTNDDNWSWPSAYMAYENSFDSVNDGYLYLKKEGTAQFNVVLTYLDKNAEAHELYLSEVAQIGGTDFPAGPIEDFYDVGSYIRNLGHAPDSGNVKFTKVTYYVIGEKDSYVKLYDLKFTRPFDLPDKYKTFMNSNITQLSGVGSYSYNNGTLTMNATGNDGYSIKMNLNDSFDPTAMKNLLMDVDSTAPFNVTMELKNGNGDATMEFKNEFFNVFELSTVPAALPSGAWNVEMYLLGYYEWNGGAINSSDVKSVTITLTAPGTLTLKALQASALPTVTYVQDGASSSGSLTDKPKYEYGDVNGDGKVTTTDARSIVAHIVDMEKLSDEMLSFADFDGDGKVTTADVREILASIVV